MMWVESRNKTLITARRADLVWRAVFVCDSDFSAMLTVLVSQGRKKVGETAHLSDRAEASQHSSSERRR